MLSKSAMGLLACSAVTLSLFAIGCKPEPPIVPEYIKCSASTPTASTALRVLCPSGGETFKVGDKVEIKWCYPTPLPWIYNQIKVSLWVQRGLKQCSNIKSNPIDVTPNSLTDSWVWEIPEIFVRPPVNGIPDTVHLAGQTECFISVSDYGDQETSVDATSYFSITAP